MGFLAAALFSAAAAYAQEAPSPGPYTQVQADAGTGNELGVWRERGERRSGFHPKIEVSETWVDNVDLAGPGQDKRSDLITQVIPGFTYDVNRSSLAASVDYSAQGVFYADNGNKNQVFHQLDANALATVVRDLFYIEGTAGASQQVLDPAGPMSTGLSNIVDTGGNLTNAYTAALTPILRRRMGNVVAEARYRRGIVKYDQVDTNETGSANLVATDSNNDELVASVGTDEESQSPLLWSVRYERQSARYDGGFPEFVYEEALGQLGYRIGRQLTLRAEGGTETQLIGGINAGSQDHSFWRGGFSYASGNRYELRAMAGKRYFGTTFDVLGRYEGRMLSMWASYVEGPTTASQELFLRPTSVLQAPVAGDYLPSVTNEVFVRKYLDARATLRGRFTSIEFEFGNYRRVYVTDTARDDRTMQYGASLLRRLGARSSVRVGVSGRRFTIVEAAGTPTRERSYRAEYLRTLSRTLTGSVVIGHSTQSGPASDYNLNFVSLRLGKTF